MLFSKYAISGLSAALAIATLFGSFQLVRANGLKQKNTILELRVEDYRRGSALALTLRKKNTELAGLTNLLQKELENANGSEIVLSDDIIDILNSLHP